MDTSPNNSSQEELIDKIATRVANLAGNTQAVKRIRRSQLLSALVGAVGFALFVNGIEDMFSYFPDWVLVLAGLVLMSTTGLLLQNLNR